MNQHKSLLLAFMLLNASASYALDTFKCVRDLLPITEQSESKIRRQETEAPFMLGERYMVFREKHEGKVAGFYVYTESDAIYYDSMDSEGAGRKIPLTELFNSTILYDLVAQPLKLETISIPYAERRPSNEPLRVRKVAHLSTLNPKSTPELWKPLMSELESRKSWIQGHNIPEDAFRRLARIMETTCKP